VPARSSSSRQRIAIVTNDAITEKMAGPAIRAWHMATELSHDHQVALITTGACTRTSADFRCTSIRTPGLLRQWERWCDVFLFQGFVMVSNPWLRTSDKVIVVDLYDPFHLEQLEQSRDLDPIARRTLMDATVSAVNDQLLRGDFFLCASGKQRDFWLGQLAAVGRINTLTYDEQPDLHRLIRVAPFGLAEQPPVQTRHAIKGAVNGIGADDKVVIWGGGIYNWFDPLTLVKAIDRLQRYRSDIRLFFMGTKHPNPEVPEMRVALATRDLADRLALTDKYVFFNDGWIPYTDRQNYLLDADIGVSTHLDHVETAFSFRTRILDYLWTGLPIVCTRGDTFADLVERADLGRTVAPDDDVGLANAIDALLSDPDELEACRRRVRATSAGFHWRPALEPLLEFCARPRRAPDLLDRERQRRFTFVAEAFAPRRTARGDVDLLRAYYRSGGMRMVMYKSRMRARRQLSRALPFVSPPAAR
jgi:glycosyltransferase involved in cell wall biosynthesis